MELEEWRKKTEALDDIEGFDPFRPEKVGTTMTLKDAAELAKAAVLRPTVDGAEDEKVLRTLATALERLAKE